MEQLSFFEEVEPMKTFEILEGHRVFPVGMRVKGRPSALGCYAIWDLNGTHLGIILPTYLREVEL